MASDLLNFVIERKIYIIIYLEKKQQNCIMQQNNVIFNLWNVYRNFIIQNFDSSFFKNRILNSNTYKLKFDILIHNLKFKIKQFLLFSFNIELIDMTLCT